MARVMPSFAVFFLIISPPDSIAAERSHTQSTAVTLFTKSEEENSLSRESS